MSRLPWILAALTLGIEAPALLPPPFRLTDHVTFWYAGHLLATGRDPYDASLWELVAVSNVNVREVLDLGFVPWPYPPWTGFLFLPFGLLPVEIGLPALHAAYLVVALASAGALARLLPYRNAGTATLALLLVLTFQPLIYTLRIGHFGTFLFAGAVLATHGLVRRTIAPLAAGAVLLFAKPHLAVIFALVVFGVLLRRRDRRAIAWTAASVVALAIVGLAFRPEALGALRAGAGERLSQLGSVDLGRFTNAWALANELADGAWPLVGAALLALAAAGALATVRWSSPALRTWALGAVALSLSLFATPYVFSYDFLLLVPCGLVALALADAAPPDRRVGLLALSVATIAVVPWLLFLVGVARTPIHALSGLVPLLFVLLAAWSARRATSP